MARRDSLGVAPQSGWGVPEDTMEFYIPVESVDVNHNLETIEVEETTGTRFPARIERGTRFAELTISGPARVESIGRLLYATFGEPTTDGTDAPAYEHTFDPAAEDAVPLPISARVARVDPQPDPIVDLFHDALVNELTLSCEPNGYFSYQASLIARDYEVEESAPEPTYDFSERFPFHRLTAYLDVDGAGEVEIPLASWSMTYSNNIPTDVFVLGQRTLWELVEDNASCEVTFAPRADMADYYRRALADNPTACALRLEAVGGDIGTGSVPDGSFRIEVTLHLIEETDAPASLNAAERMTMIDVTARAALDPDSGSFVTVVVENETASYEQPTS